jgi:hypothetical protein
VDKGLHGRGWSASSGLPGLVRFENKFEEGSSREEEDCLG